MLIRRLRRLSIPLIAVLAVAGPVYWAFPDGLPFWRATGIVLGWVGWGLLLASLLLMIREAPLAEWLGGLERMYRWHHRLGLLAYGALLAHPLALSLDGERESPARAWAALSPWQLGWSEQLGWLALLLMMVGLAFALSRQLPYARWRWLHHLLSLAMLAAFLHLLLLGLDEVALATPLFAIGLIVWRVIRGDQGLAARPYLVTSVEKIGAGVVEVALRPLGDGCALKPGQFVLAAFLDGPNFRGCGEFHPFTASAIGPGGRFSLTIKALGDCTWRMQSLESGVAARVQGPFGTFMAEPPVLPQFWLAGGIGITPFMARLRQGDLTQPVQLLYLHRNAQDAAYVDELQALAASQPAFSTNVVASGDVAADLSSLIPPAAELHDRDCSLCGPPGLVAAAVAVLCRRGVPSGHIHFESFEFR